MRRGVFRIASATLACAVAWATAAAVAPANSSSLPAPPQAPAPAARFRSADREAWIRAQIGRLAEQEGFSDWIGARAERYPLGPGMHGWLVLLFQGERQVGFLTVYDDGRGDWVLGEYGRAGPDAGN